MITGATRLNLWIFWLTGFTHFKLHHLPDRDV